MSAVPGDAGAQLGELVAGVAAGEHVEHRLEHRPGERGVRGRPADQGEHVVDGPLVERAHRDDLLGEHVERGVRAGAAPRSGPASMRSTTTAVCTRSPRNFGKSTPRLTAPTWWPARPTRCSPEATDGGDSTCTTRSTAPMSMPSSRLLVATTAGQPPRLQVLLDDGALLLAHRAVVGAGEHGGRAARRAGLRHDLGGAAGERGGARHGIRRTDGVGTVGGLDALLPDLVEPGGEALGEPAGVGEDEGRGVLGDEVDDALLDVRPDRGALLLAGGRPAEVAGGLPELGHVGHRDDDLEVPLLGRRRLHDVDGAAAGEVAGDLLDRPDGGGQPDALRGPLEVGVEPLEGEGQVGAALGAGQRVHLVDDDRLDAGERLAGGRGEDEEQRLGRGDEDVGGGAREGAALVGRGVARAHRDGDVGLGQPEAGGGVPDADERAAQVALDVDGERLHRRDVEHPAARQPGLGQRLGGQPVERPEEGRQGLARPGRARRPGRGGRC